MISMSMNRNNLIAKTILKLASVTPINLKNLIKSIETENSVEMINKLIRNFLIKEAKKDDEKQVVYDRLKQDPFLQTNPHKDAIKMIEKEYPFLVK